MDLCNNIALVNKSKCFGCAACVYVCPNNCIVMCSDSEGYLYPSVDSLNCISCGRCLNSCAINYIAEYKDSTNRAYVGFSGDNEIRKKSSSGGVFALLAMAIIKNDGVVYGASFMENMNVEHIRIETENDLSQLMRSKYVQSDIEKIYTMIKTDLKNGRKILFVGTPCQVAAINNIFGVDDNLVLVDFICHGVPSPGVWRSYVDMLEKEGKHICSVNFRNKKYGWHDYSLKIEYLDGDELLEDHAQNAYMRSFLCDNNIRPSCYSCQFKGDNTCSNITLGDAWKIEKIYFDWSDDKGVSLVITRNQTGEELLQSLDMEGLVLRTTDYESWTVYNPSLITSSVVPVGREAFYKNYNQFSSEIFWDDLSKISAKERIKIYVKIILRALRISKYLRR